MIGGPDYTTPIPTRDPAAALRAWRAAVGYSQGAVGALYGVSKSMVGHWERHRSPVPRRVRRLLRAEGWLGGACTRWSAEEHAWLLAHVGTAPAAVLARQLTARFGVSRTTHAVLTRLQKRRLSRQVTGLLTRAQCARLCGVSEPTVTAWVRRGWLPLPFEAQPVRRGIWAVAPATLRAFVAAYAVHLDVACMPPSPYRDLATARWAHERWLTPGMIARQLGVHHATVCGWIAEAGLPAVRRYRGPMRAYAIRSRDLAAWLRAREAVA